MLLRCAGTDKPNFVLMSNITLRVLETFSRLSGELAEGHLSCFSSVSCFIRAHIGPSLFLWLCYSDVTETRMQTVGPCLLPQILNKQRKKNSTCIAQNQTNVCISEENLFLKYTEPPNAFKTASKDFKEQLKICESGRGDRHELQFACLLWFKCCWKYLGYCEITKKLSKGMVDILFQF